MPIPYPEKYMQPELGLGKLANYQNTQADTKVAGESIPFGSPVEATGGEVKAFATGTFFGIALADNFVKEIGYDGADKVGEYPKSKPVPILRKGSIWIKVTEDVEESEPAAATTGGFKVGTTGDTIGIFQSTAQAGGLAILQINLP